MDRFSTSDLMLARATAAREFTRAELVFYGVEHRGPSFEARVFLDEPEAGVNSALELEAGFAGSFVVLGHGGCFGDDGHCKVPTGPPDPFDSRPPHALVPQTKTVDVTEALKHPRREGERISITVLPIVPGPERAGLADVLFFTGLRLLTYR